MMNQEEWAHANSDKIQVEEVDFIEMRKTQRTNCLVLFTFKRTKTESRIKTKTEPAG